MIEIDPLSHPCPFAVPVSCDNPGTGCSKVDYGSTNPGLKFNRLFILVCSA